MPAEGIKIQKVMRISNCFSGLLVALFVSVTACDNTDKETDVQQGIAINSIEATSAIDLSVRSEWLFRVGYSNLSCHYYDYKIDGNKLYALAEKPNVHRFDKRWKEGDILGTPHRLICYLQDKRYYRSTSSRTMRPEDPDILDQSTEELFLVADRLEASYRGNVQSDIEGLTFTHSNTLIEYKIEGVNEGVKIHLYNFTYRPTIPLKNGTNSYKAIVYGSASIIAQVGDYTDRLEITDRSYSNTHYRVKAHWDANNKKVVLDDLKKEEWK